MDDKARRKAELDQFGDRLRRAPEKVQQLWAEKKKLPKNDPGRQTLYQLIKDAKKGDYTECFITAGGKASRDTGSTSRICRWPFTPNKKQQALRTFNSKLRIISNNKLPFVGLTICFEVAQ